MNNYENIIAKQNVASRTMRPSSQVINSLLHGPPEIESNSEQLTSWQAVAACYSSAYSERVCVCGCVP